MNIYVFIGVVGSGKDYAARQVGGLKIAFADKLREMVWRLVGWKPKNDDEYELFKEMVFKSGKICFTGREILERVGTEIVREINPEYWIETVEDRIHKVYRQKLKSEDLNICITDARFVNEINMLRDLHLFYDNISVNFVFCDYYSFRYDPNRTHDCEKLAQGLLKKGFKHGDSLNEFFKEDKWKDYLNI